MTGKADKTELEKWKQMAGEYAVQFIEDGMIVGLGYGSTAIHALRLLGRRIASGDLSRIKAIPTSDSVGAEARAAGIPLTGFSEHLVIDITIDGADEVDPGLNLIKGGGGALLKEKIVAQATRREIIVVDESKLSPQLGARFALPVEVLPFALEVQQGFLESLGASVKLRQTSTGKAFITDSGNYILDCHFGPIEQPQDLSRKLESQAGIIEHGLFLGLADELVVANASGIRHLRKSEI
jgi:ribose 5-phosphate isomerase A